jgi:hypothetical protein
VVLDHKKECMHHKYIPYISILDIHKIRLQGDLPRQLPICRLWKTRYLVNFISYNFHRRFINNKNSSFFNYDTNTSYIKSQRWSLLLFLNSCGSHASPPLCWGLKHSLSCVMLFWSRYTSRQHQIWQLPFGLLLSGLVFSNSFCRQIRWFW